MNSPKARRTIVALGLSLAVASAAGIQMSAAQPRTLPAQPQNQDRPYDYDRQFDRGGDSGYGPTYDLRGYDSRDRRGDRDFARPEERLERRLSFLHDQLRITPAQEREWRIFAQAIQDEGRGRGQDARRSQDNRQDPPSVVERLERRQNRLAERMERVDHILTALRPLYASLSDEQKQTADRLMFQAEQRFAQAGRRGLGFRDGQGFGRDGRFGPRDRDYRDYR